MNALSLSGSLRAALVLAATGLGAVGAPAVAHAQDAGTDAGRPDAGAPPAADAGGGGGALPTVPMCPGAINTADVPVSFMRNGPVDFGPGTGMRMVGDRTFGAEFNLLFSGTYRLAMAGTIHVNWLGGVTPLTLTTDGRPGSGNFNVVFGLRMVGRIYILGVAIDLPLSRIIDDMEGMGSRTFDPWQYTFNDATRVDLPVSAWRTIFTRTVTIMGEEYPVEVQARYNMQAWARTQEIGFPNRASGAMGMVFGTINESTPSVTIPVPRDGRLNLAVRWKPQLRYRGTIQLRFLVRRRVCAFGVCTNVDVPTPADFAPIALSNEPLPDPFEPTDTPVLLPLSQFTDPEIDFGSVRLGTTGMQNIVVMNPGASPLAIAASTPGEMAFRLTTNSTCVSPAGMGMFPIAFTPPGRGEFRSEITLASNSANNNPHRIRLIGTGAEETRPPVRTDAGSSGSDASARTEGGVGVPGTNREFGGLQQDATCACRAAGAPARADRLAWSLGALAALGVIRRRRERAA
jgi:MYXO-CTERM domain-containing protein